MAGFVEGVDRGQGTLLPALLDDYVAGDNPVRAVDVFVDGLDLDKLGFVGVQALDTGRPGYHPRMMLKLYIYGYLNRVPSSRRLERECQRNIEMIWLTGQLAPDFKTIADFRRTMARPFERSAASSSHCAASLICSVLRAWRSTDRSSRRSMRETRTSLRPR
jgi:transposase